MPASKDVSLQADISKMGSQPDGSFKRAPASFRNTIEKGGKFEPEGDRYHLYVSYACPWATRTLIVWKLKGLEALISMSVVSPHMGSSGWPFASVDQFPCADIDPLYNSQHVKDLYLRCEPNYNGRFTVPVLWDKKHETIVNNKSSEIIRIFNSAFNHLIPKEKVEVDIYPERLRAEIDGVNEWVYDTVNNGVYKSGFATTQQAYESNVVPLFDSLDRLEKMLEGKSTSLATNSPKLMFDFGLPSFIRFDPVYVGHFKCNIRTIRGRYAAINKWMKKLYWTNPAFKDSTDFDHIKTSYYWSHPSVNPTHIIPVGPIPNIEPL
ncbi:hypothetical protein JAAARDRAFT_63226 [Jaapia argillacea MUCL 33604]|uniref:GST N-terminal domain-containing protein n=1 Tax=Jaapia argillacea MUCL 33604 TaxID=933084 RepID=A0A067P6C4_9AGAM|nr:hypothetical protein JAAARDRAFT_63226 [Jaapia argillacea MUCL 33604]